jgi:hypothetical protein
MFRKIKGKKGHFISIQQKYVVLNRGDWVCMLWYGQGPSRAHGVGGPKHTNTLGPFVFLQTDSALLTEGSILRDLEVTSLIIIAGP